ncbi:uncharacterized protein [Watersipora subatra]|uniref:uncharacterized protein n=1 Tax=Watersipora subatra TaxID=2589382 RepID=UPI00355B5C5C
MAAPLHGLIKKRVIPFAKINTICTSQSRYATSKCTYVLIPEVPPDTAETNTLMDIKSLPDWSRVTPSSAYRGCGKLALMYETHLAAQHDKLKDFGQATSFDDIFKPMEEVSVPLQNAYNVVKHLSTVKKKTFADTYEGIFKHVHNTRSEPLSDEIVYHKAKELHSNPKGLTESQLSLVSKYLRECKRVGVELTGKMRDTFEADWNTLVEHQDDFRRSVYFSSRSFKHTIYDPHAVSEMPEAVRNRLASNPERPEEGPWTVGVSSSALHEPVLKYSPDRRLRELIWKELVGIASVKHALVGMSTKSNIEKIRLARRDMAKRLGYNSYAELAMEHQMAGSVETVMEFVETLRSAFQPEAQDEMGQLLEYASSHGFNDSLQMWDMQYWSNKQCKDLYSTSLRAPSEYFSLPRVLDGLFQICRALFGVDIKKNESDVSVWHPSVQVFDVFDEDGTERGTFFLDAYTRLGEKYAGAWINRGRDRSALYQCNPTCYLNLNINPSLGRQRAIMSIADVASLFGMMGHTLQQLLTTVDYSQIAGQNNIESDALHTASTFMVMWLFRPDTLQSLSYHHETGESLVPQQLSDIIATHNHMYSSNLMEKLFRSVYDLEMHFSERHFDTALRQIWPRYMLLPLDQDYCEPNSMVDVFADDSQASGIYGALWSEMVAADIMKSFNECTNLDELKTTGRRFKDTVLSLGGSVPAMEVFRRFKGHDPSIDSLLQLRLPRQSSD